MPYKDRQTQLEAMRRLRKIKYQKRKDERKCPDCGVPLIEDEGVFCTTCRFEKDYGWIRGIL